MKRHVGWIIGTAQICEKLSLAAVPSNIKYGKHFRINETTCGMDNRKLSLAFSPHKVWKRQAHAGTWGQRSSMLLVSSPGNWIRGWKPGDITIPANQYVLRRFCRVAAPSHLPIHGASGQCPIPSPSRRSQLQLCGWLFTTNLVQHHMGMCVDDDTMRLGRPTSEHPASRRRTSQSNTSKTGIDVLGGHGTREPSSLGS